MKVMRFRFRGDAFHTRCRVFIGEEGQTLANVGTLTFRTEEFNTVRERLIGAHPAGRTASENRRALQIDFEPDIEGMGAQGGKQ